ncbi:hypothetical protein Tsubulata_000720 [Turnera subulata]|uniref:Uncharacterized protein n=1 Tax=Turnera subulata TaxID=218843 RepID=A0A9Q0F749_9ROSI|nr:hypothetical protein Tsubulata_000720 [Turnera subulata]
MLSPHPHSLFLFKNPPTLNPPPPSPSPLSILLLLLGSPHLAAKPNCSYHRRLEDPTHEPATTSTSPASSSRSSFNSQRRIGFICIHVEVCFNLHPL